MSKEREVLPVEYIYACWPGYCMKACWVVSGKLVQLEFFFISFIVSNHNRSGLGLLHSFYVAHHDCCSPSGSQWVGSQEHSDSMIDSAETIQVLCIANHVPC